MNRRAALAGALLCLLLAACGADSDVEDARYTVIGELGEVPTATFETPLPLAEPEVETLIEGDGLAIRDGVALVSTTTFSGTDGSIVGVPAAPSLVNVPALSSDSGIAAALRDATEGSRIAALWAVEGDDGGERMELVVLDVLPTSATGEPDEFDFASEDLPEITEDNEGVPQAHVGEGITEPDQLRVVTLVEGGGRQVLPEDEVYAQYTVWEWDTGDVYDSTWNDGAVPTMIEIDTAFPGLRDGLLDQTVGSRVLVLIPPDQGIGTDSLIAVVDILAVGRTE